MVFKMGHAGAGVASRTRHGDGSYEVFAVKDEDGNTKQLIVDFGYEEDKDCIDKQLDINSIIFSLFNFFNKSKLYHLCSLVLGNRFSCEAEKHLNFVFLPSVNLPVVFSALDKQSEAKGQAKPEGRDKEKMSFVNFAFPCENFNSLLICVFLLVYTLYTI